MRIRFRYILNQAWFCYIMTALILFVFVDKSRSDFVRLSMLQLYSEYPFKFLYQQEPYNEILFRNTIRYYQALAKVFPNLSDNYAVLGICYAETGKFSRAKYYFDRACDINKDFFWNRYNIGILEYRQKNFAEAEKIFQGISFLDSKEASLLPFDNYILKKIDNYEKVIHNSLIFNKMIVLSARKMLLQCLWEQGRYQMVFDLSHRFRGESGEKDRFIFSIWAARSIAKMSSDEMARSYLLSQQQYFQNPEFLRFLQSLNDQIETGQPLDGFFQDFLPVLDQFFIHPWRKVMPIGREVLFNDLLTKDGK